MDFRSTVAKTILCIGKASELYHKCDRYYFCPLHAFSHFVLELTVV
jgi:hypothetical protein